MKGGKKKNINYNILHTELGKTEILTIIHAKNEKDSLPEKKKKHHKKYVKFTSNNVCLRVPDCIEMKK